MNSRGIALIRKKQGGTGKQGRSVAVVSTFSFLALLTWVSICWQCGFLAVSLESYPVTAVVDIVTGSNITTASQS